MKNKLNNARFEKSKKTIIKGALHEKYYVKEGNVNFVGEILTFQNGNYWYYINFNSTEGTYSQGIKYFDTFMQKAKWNI